MRGYAAAASALLALGATSFGEFDGDASSPGLPCGSLLSASIDAMGASCCAVLHYDVALVGGVQCLASCFVVRCHHLSLSTSRLPRREAINNQPTDDKACIGNREMNNTSETVTMMTKT